MDLANDLGTEKQRRTDLDPKFAPHITLQNKTSTSAPAKITTSLNSNMPMAAALSYHEPGITTILILTSFFLLLNAVNYVLDNLIYCGLVGQIFMGVAWGAPGANWLSEFVQETVMQLGYLGLILLVYEGGVSTSTKALKANLLLSGLVAVIGISAPIGLSFILMRGLLPDLITPVQAFAAGAALCSTSLGTTFTVLATSRLTESRLGVVLTSAAMMDDVAGLVMVQVISSLGESFDAVTAVGRPIGVSVGFAVVVPIGCLVVIRPVTRGCYRRWCCGGEGERTWKWKMMDSRETMMALHTAILVAFITCSSFAGTSNLFAAYLAGACIAWWDGLCCELTAGPQGMMSATTSALTSEDSDRPTKIKVADDREQDSKKSTATPVRPHPPPIPPTSNARDPKFSGKSIYEHYYGAAVSNVLKPLFFASIGFSIPITKMFSGSVIWRGLVYSALMALGKLLCGLCLVRFSGQFPSLEPWKKLPFPNPRSCWPSKTPKATSVSAAEFRSRMTPAGGGSGSEERATKITTSEDERKWTIPKPRSLYPAAILGSAMVARGEIGFLISSVAESNGIFGSGSDGGSSDLFLTVTWAILLCTILGPVTVGLLVGRVRRLQIAERGRGTGTEDPLGIWGIVETVS